MKLTRSINLQGVVFTIDEDAYQLLKDYLADIESRLPQDEQKDVMDDLESRIAELLQSALFAQNSESVTINMVRSVRTRIGEPDEFGENKRPVIKRERITRQGVGRVLSIVLKAILIIIAIQIFFPVLAIIFALLMALFGVSIGGMALMPALGFELLGGSTGWTWLLCLSIIAALGIPVYMLVHWIVKYSRERRHPSLRFWIITLLIWILSLCGLAASAGRMVKVNGNDLLTAIEVIDNWDESEGDWTVVDEQREVEPFHAVMLSSALRVDIHVGEQQTLQVHYSRPGEVESRVEDGVLIIEGRGNHSGRAIICVPEMDCLTAVGASKVKISGVADSMQIDLAGASKLQAEELSVRDMHITVAGASKAEVNVSGSLWAEAIGASKIMYYGNPKVEKSVSLGASKIRRG